MALEDMTLVDKTMAWKTRDAKNNRGKEGIARVELFSIGQTTFISVKRVSGSKPPARLLGHIVTSAIGPAWWLLTRSGREVRIRKSRSGRVSVRCRGQKKAIRVDPNGRVEDFVLPLNGLADLVGPAGLGGPFETAAPIEFGVESVRRV